MYPRLARGDPTLVANLRENGHGVDLPLAFLSVEDLALCLEAWRVSYPSEHPPGSVALVTQEIEIHRVFTTAIYFATTSEVVYVERLKILSLLMGWVLKDRDGACMLVKDSPDNTNHRRGYHGWLGELRGFSILPIADSYRNHGPSHLCGPDGGSALIVASLVCLC